MPAAAVALVPGSIVPAHAVTRCGTLWRGFGWAPGVRGG